MQMKRTLGMLLALCFLMSVTVAAVGANGNNNFRPGGNYTDHHPVAPPHPPVAPPSYHHPVAPPSYYHPAPLVPIFKPGHGPIAKPVFKPIAKPVFKPIAKPVFKPIAKPVFKPIAKPVFKPIAKPVFKPIAKPVFKPIAKKVTYKLVKIPAHFETKKVKKFVGFKHGKKVYKTVTIKIFVHAKWIKVPVYNNHNNNHR